MAYIQYLVCVVGAEKTSLKLKLFHQMTFDPLLSRVCICSAPLQIQTNLCVGASLGGPLDIVSLSSISP